MDNRLFRQKSIDRVSSPEQLQDHMRVTNPGVWMILAAVSARGQDAETLAEGMTLRVRNGETKIAQVKRFTSDTAEATAPPIGLPDGEYEAVVDTEVITPIRFLTN